MLRWTCVVLMCIFFFFSFFLIFLGVCFAWLNATTTKNQNVPLEKEGPKLFFGDGSRFRHHPPKYAELPQNTRAVLRRSAQVCVYARVGKRE